MKYVLLWLVIMFPSFSNREKEKITLSQSELADKIKGGWYGQVIWRLYTADSTVLFQLDRIPELDRDMIVLDVIASNDLSHSRDSFAGALLQTPLPLSHADASVRSNLLRGVRSSQAGKWVNNPHADDNNFMSSSDVIGLAFPAMPSKAAELCNAVGHVNSQGDGYYSGLMIATLYSLAFYHKDLRAAIDAAMHTLPARSKINQALQECLNYCQQFPQDPRAAKTKFLARWNSEVHCPDRQLEIDSKYTMAMLIMGLIYGKGDLEKTLTTLSELSAPKEARSAAGGILGVMQGFKNISARFTNALNSFSSLAIPFTDLSTDQAWQQTFRLALNNIEANHGKVKTDDVVIGKGAVPVAREERSFEGHCNKEKRELNGLKVTDKFDFQFEGVGFVLSGILPYDGSIPPRTIRAELYLNNKFIEDVRLTLDHETKSTDLVWKLQLPYKKYNASLRILDPCERNSFRISQVIVYDVPLN